MRVIVCLRAGVLCFTYRLNSGIVHAPAYGFAQVSPAEVAENSARTATLRDGKDGGLVLENEFVRVSVASDGTIDSIFDKRAQREAVEQGKRANKYD